MNAERYLSAKELSAALRERGLDYSEKWVRRAWDIGCPRVGKFALLSETILWLRENPDAKPRARPEIGISNL